jgi:hypothetical protein
MVILHGRRLFPKPQVLNEVLRQNWNPKVSAATNLANLGLVANPNAPTRVTGAKPPVEFMGKAQSHCIEAF